MFNPVKPKPHLLLGVSIALVLWAGSVESAPPLPQQGTPGTTYGFWPSQTITDQKDRYFYPAVGYAIPCSNTVAGLTNGSQQGKVIDVYKDITIDPAQAKDTVLSAHTQSAYCAIRRYPPYFDNQGYMPSYHDESLPAYSWGPADITISMVTEPLVNSGQAAIYIQLANTASWLRPFISDPYTASIYGPHAMGPSSSEWHCPMGFRDCSTAGTTSYAAPTPQRMTDVVIGTRKNLGAFEEVNDESAFGIYHKYASLTYSGKRTPYTLAGVTPSYPTIFEVFESYRPPYPAQTPDYGLLVNYYFKVKFKPCPVAVKVHPETIKFRELHPSEATRAGRLLDTQSFAVDVSSACAAPKGMETVFSASSGTLSPITLPGSVNSNQLVPIANDSVGIVLKTHADQAILLSPNRLTGSEANYQDYKVPISRNDSNQFKAELYSTKALTVGAFEASVKVDVYYP